MVQFLLERLRTTRLGGKVIFATTERSDDDSLAAKVAEIGIAVFRGADADVAGRYLGAARKFGVDWIVRVTADCPFVDAWSLDYCLSQWRKDIATDLWSTKGAFPVGIDYELFSSSLLAREWPKMDAPEKEHLTLRFYRPELGFAVRKFQPPASWPNTDRSYLVDTPDDYKRACGEVAMLSGWQFSVQQLLQLPRV